MENQEENNAVAKKSKWYLNLDNFARIHYVFMAIGLISVCSKYVWDTIELNDKMTSVENKILELDKQFLKETSDHSLNFNDKINDLENDVSELDGTVKGIKFVVENMSDRIK